LGVSSTLGTDILISGGFFQDVSIHANNLLVSGGTWVDTHLNGMYFPFFQFSTLSSSIYPYPSINLSITCAFPISNPHRLRISCPFIGFRSSFNCLKNYWPALYCYNKELQDLQENENVLHQENEALKQENNALRKEIADLNKKSEQK
jgi:hypothetical protein